MKLIFGLGNPGPEFDNTPHNVGFATVDKLAESFGVAFKKVKKKGLFAEAVVGEQKVILVKPQTYIKNSGDCVYDYVRKFKVEKQDILVILDDVDLTASLARMRPSGSASTHNGLRSVTARLGTTEFPRIYIGVDSKSRGSDLTEYVLRKMDAETLNNVSIGIEKAVEFVKTFVSTGVNSET